MLDMKEVYSDFFYRLPYEHPAEYQHRFRNKIMLMTGLDEKIVPLYEMFVDAASLGTGVVMYGEVKHRMTQALSAIMGQRFNDEYVPMSEKRYWEIVKLFEEKKLIEWFTTTMGAKYPRIIGYNYFDDPEFYIATRTKGKQEWNGRISVDLIHDKHYLCTCLNAGEEFREKFVLDTIRN